jgi:DsbC/DsbD-like thiol-disulfide interchange protein
MTPSSRLLAFAAAGAFASAVATLSDPSMAEDAAFASAAVEAAHSSARLLAAGPAQGGVYRAGVEIGLEPKTITYWRQPGEAGSPPVFDFSRSRNVAAIETFYPAPKHIEEAGIVVAGYDARVIFPLRVTPRDPKAPVVLELALDYAACGKICLPAKAQLSLRLPVSGASPHAEAIASAERQVPRKVSEAEAKKLLALERRGGKEENLWSLRYLGPGRARDVFAEAPEPLYLESKRAGASDSFDLELFSPGEKPKGAAATLTILTDHGAIEAPARLE